MSGCDDVRDVLPLYALGVADTDEARAAEEHVAACAACAEELASLNTTVSSLSLAGEPMTPPASLRARVLAATGWGEAADARPPGRLFRLLPAAAAALVVALLVGSWIYSRQETSLQEQVTALLEDPDALRIRIESTSQKGTEVATALRDRSRGPMHVILRGLALPAQGRSHVVWLLPRTGSPVNAKARRLYEAHFVIDELPLPVDDLAGVAISEETSPDVTAPTQVVAAGMR